MAVFTVKRINEQGQEEDSKVEVLSTQRGGGFRIISQKDQQIDLVDWDETENADFFDKSNQVIIQDLSNGHLQFRDAGDYNKFKQMRDENKQYKEIEDPFA